MTLDVCLADLVSDNARRFGDQPAYLADGQVRTHRELYERADRLTAALEARGLRRQDRVAVFGRNSIQFGEVLAMGQVSGIVVATVNFRLAPAEVVAILADAAPRVLFVDADCYASVAELLPTLGCIEVIVALDPLAGTTPDDCEDYEDFLASADGRSRTLCARPDDIACLIYTSGTTGKPKGCMLGQRGLHRVAFTTNNEMRTGSSDRVLLVMPMFHIGAMAIGLALHARGGCCVLRRQFEPADALHVIASDDITALHLAPTMLQALLEEADSRTDHRLTGVRVVVYSAAPITSSTLAAAMTAMPDAGFTNMYGQTEVITSGLPFEFHTRGNGERSVRRLSSVGIPFPGNRVRIVDDDGEDLPTGTAGEIIVRSETMFLGYWNNSITTAETIRDGWCHTGDIGIVDHDGLLHLVDRKKDVIISGGENIYSLEVEDAISAHPDVAECAVVGVQDKRWGEAVTAVVVLRSNARLTLEGLREYLAPTLARYKLPRSLRSVGELPKLPTGKLDKKALRATLT
ncbi:AMP-binding protein [Gordonia rubripertincta]|uniref:AMP-binding protein n=2 Tax=Gordonia rubripertincta TaxID=36822 RepID=A0AAW6RBX6_GORRU|nr:AMP-binding protein [Gordonia rubripertincta]MDG6782118.1 AMP-binding protein [Gordonia rubripertincta]NKY64679.1 AMP-binding protein [Gordonia rubripertincta]GAB86264.1 fatty-acid--CoA ligase [Gordonia rubripertincta NBRC 101908]